ncbi:hypothetical protein Tco_0727526 [Tanacetum coccineum]|uniref:Integrase, catalytic region, zinc finger, CCHC-type, peptidase aspartic, catalytic n=1 Tax=Tanacetum coccineum TaxID=301880 RepID=A0ABQ4YJJ1_9ASTR
MTGNLSQLMNFVSKFMGTVRFENDQVAKIMGYNDYQQGNITYNTTFHDIPTSRPLIQDLTSQGSSSNVRPSHTPFELSGRWTKDHPIANVIGDLSRSISIRKQLKTDDMWCYFDGFLTSVEPKNF